MYSGRLEIHSTHPGALMHNSGLEFQVQSPEGNPDSSPPIQSPVYVYTGHRTMGIYNSSVRIRVIRHVRHITQDRKSKYDAQTSKCDALTSKCEVAGPIWRACIHRLSREEFLSSACCSVVVLTAK